MFPQKHLGKLFDSQVRLPEQNALTPGQLKCDQEQRRKCRVKDPETALPPEGPGHGPLSAFAQTAIGAPSGPRGGSTGLQPSNKLSAAQGGLQWTAKPSLPDLYDDTLHNAAVNFF